jgi:hypothetical protein
MLAIVYLACGLHSNFVWDFLVLLLSAIIGAALGLTISALSKTTESAIALMPMVLLPIIAMGGVMRPIYLMPKAGQMASALIPSRWAFEANLLHEADAKQWGPKQEIPDLTCNIELPPNPDGSQPAMPSMMPGSAMPSPGSLPPGAPALPAGFDISDINPSLHVEADSAEIMIPAYLIEFTDPSGADHSCRASAQEQYPRLNPISHAVPNRHRFLDSMMVLGAMLLALVAGIISILRSRDNDPQ